jgi:hypothetical protein
LIEPLDVMLSTGFFGSAYWSRKQMPVPFSFAFWLQPQQFSGIALNPVFPFGLAFKLVFDNDGSDAPSSICFTHGFLLDGILD